MLRVIANLRLADRIPPAGQVDLTELAQQCGVQSLPLLRMLRALAAFDVFGVTLGQHVRHTARSRLLRTNSSSSMHYGARFWAGPGIPGRPEACWK